MYSQNQYSKGILVSGYTFFGLLINNIMKLKLE